LAGKYQQKEVAKGHLFFNANHQFYIFFT